MSAEPSAFPADVLRCDRLGREIDGLVRHFGMQPVHVAPGRTIPGSFWGAPEAGLIDDRIHWRADTPVHSLLHELAHFVCMAPDRRARLHTDAGGNDLEECAVCYLEVCLAAHLPWFGVDRCLADMDAWGYSFRQGSARAWFDGDGLEAREWLRVRGLIDAYGRPSGRLREQA